MKRNKFLVLFLVAVCFSPIQLFAQALGDYTKEQVESYQAKAEDQVRFMAYLFNTLGSAQSSHRDKDVIIKESYLKIFRDGKVQIEDDLTENRQVLINKDVTAYLKDIDFFFREVKFDFELKETEAFLRENGGLSFKIEVKRTLKGVDIEGESVLNSKTRFVEINLDPETDELQIASMYTTKVSREEALTEWWNNLSLAWKDVFKEKIGVEADSIEMQQLYRIASLDSINLSGDNFIVNLEPISMLVDLKKIDLSHTKIEDLSPLSGLTELRNLNISHSAVTELSFLRYAEQMEKLDLSFTAIQEIDALENFKQLKELKLTGSDIRDFKVLGNFEKLRALDLSETFFNQIEVLSSLAQLEELNLAKSNVAELSSQLSPNTLKILDVSYAFVSDLNPLKDYKSLHTLNINNTQVESLLPLESVSSLEKVYADHTFVSENAINDFIDRNPNILLIVNSEELSEWWSNLSADWKHALSPYIKISRNKAPEKEQLTKLLLLDSLNIDNSGITELTPLIKFSRLRYLSISDNRINSLMPLETLMGLTEVTAQNIGLNNVSSIVRLKKVQRLNLAENRLSELHLLQLAQLNALKYLNIDQNGIGKEAVGKFLSLKVNDFTLIYDAVGLSNWWRNLGPTWQQIFKVQFPMDNPPSPEDLHNLTTIKTVMIMDEPISDLNPLAQFVHLESLHLERVGLQSLESVSAVADIQKLTITGTAITDLEPLTQLQELKDLNLDFTAVSDLKSLEDLPNLERLSLAGTQIKSVKGLESLNRLYFLDISSTQVRWIGKLDLLNNLEDLVCYNTRIFDFSLNKFKEANPDCEVRHY